MQTVTLAELLTLHSLGYATDRWGTPTTEANCHRHAQLRQPGDPGLGLDEFQRAVPCLRSRRGKAARRAAV